MSKKEMIKKIGQLHEALYADKKSTAKELMTNDIEAAIAVLNDVLKDAWDAEFKVDIYLDKDDKVCPVFYE